MMIMAPGVGLPAVCSHCFGAAATAADCSSYAASSVPMASSCCAELHVAGLAADLPTRTHTTFLLTSFACRDP